MIKYIGENYKIVFQNFTALFSVQALSYLFPFFTFPYLTLKLGIIAFGKYGYFLALISFIDSLVAYGFRVSATNEIAQYSEDRLEVSRIASAVFISKVGILMVILIISLLAFLFDVFGSDLRFYLIGLGFIIGNILFPVWLYQGMQKMVYITYVNIFAKSVFTIAIFIGVRSPDDLLFVVGAHSCAYLAAGFLAFLGSIKLFELKLRWPGINEVRDQMSRGLAVFLAQLSVSMYTNLNLLVYGIFAGDIALGIYTITEKVYKLGITLSAPFNRAIFPYMAKVWRNDRYSYKVRIGHLIKPLFFVFAILSIIVFVFAPQIIDLLTDDIVNRRTAILSLRMLSIGISFAPFGGLFTYALVIQGEDKTLLRLVMLIVGINWICFYPLINAYDILGISILTVLVSFSVAIIKGIYVFRKLEDI